MRLEWAREKVAGFRAIAKRERERERERESLFGGRDLVAERT